ncbi:MAG: F0F1 ATP synthase subunit B [Prevotellaceae bacterium]|jgi:F-type H+-transporting ATPase subunit b|nr:F0F1 ATP synthase subunit B [Prevotellaceae bacterium]
MSLLTPDLGLLFWMLVAFGVVFFILAKYGWPVIVGMVEERSNFINNSVKSAQEANLKLAQMKELSEEIMAKAREEQMQMLQEAGKTRDAIVAEAKNQAQREADKVMENALSAIEKQKQEALREMQQQIAILSIDIAEKVLRKELADQQEQKQLVDKLIAEAF